MGASIKKERTEKKEGSERVNEGDEGTTMIMEARNLGSFPFRSLRQLFEGKGTSSTSGTKSLVKLSEGGLGRVRLNYGQKRFDKNWVALGSNELILRPN